MIEVFYFCGAQIVAVILIISKGAVIMAVKDFTDRADSLVEGKSFAGDGEGQKNNNEQGNILLPGRYYNPQFRGPERYIFLLGEGCQEFDTGTVEKINEDMTGKSKGEGGID